MIGEIRQNFTEASASVGLILATALILQSIFLQNKTWLRVQDFVDKILRLVRISLLISALQKSFAFFSRESYFIKAIENFFPVFA